MKKLLSIIFLTFFWSSTSYTSDLTDPNEIFKALHEIKSKGIYKGKTGFVMRRNNEKNFSKFLKSCPAIPNSAAPFFFAS